MNVMRIGLTIGIALVFVALIHFSAVSSGNESIITGNMSFETQAFAGLVTLGLALICSALITCRTVQELLWNVYIILAVMVILLVSVFAQAVQWTLVFTALLGLQFYFIMQRRHIDIDKLREEMKADQAAEGGEETPDDADGADDDDEEMYGK